MVGVLNEEVPDLGFSPALYQVPALNLGLVEIVERVKNFANVASVEIAVSAETSASVANQKTSIG